MDKENRLMVARWEGVRGLGEKGEEIKKFKFLPWLAWLSG